jgi:hypothetical protein
MRGVVRKAKGSRKNKGVSRYDCYYDDWCGGTINRIAVSFLFYWYLDIWGVFYGVCDFVWKPRMRGGIKSSSNIPIYSNSMFWKITSQSIVVKRKQSHGQVVCSPGVSYTNDGKAEKKLMWTNSLTPGL